MTDLLAAAPARLTPVAEQSPVTENARVGSSKVMNLGARGASPTAKVPKEVADTRLSRMEKGTELPRERPTTIMVLSKEERQQRPLLCLKQSLSPCLGLRRWGLLTL